MSSSEDEATETECLVEVESSGPQGYAFEPIREIPENEESQLSEDDIESEPDEPLPGNGRTQDMFWCTCGECMLLPLEVECRCCQEIRAIQHRVPDDKCIKFNPTFVGTCIEREALEVALLMMHDWRASQLMRPIDARLITILSVHKDGPLYNLRGPFFFSQDIVCLQNCWLLKFILPQQVDNDPPINFYILFFKYQGNKTSLVI